MPQIELINADCMTITITLTLPEAQALAHTLRQCLHLAERSRTIADALGVTPEIREQAALAAERIKLPRGAKQN